MTELAQMFELQQSGTFFRQLGRPGSGPAGRGPGGGAFRHRLPKEAPAWPVRRAQACCARTRQVWQGHDSAGHPGTGPVAGLVVGSSPSSAWACAENTGSLPELTVAQGFRYLAACLPMALGSLFSAIAQRPRSCRFHQHALPRSRTATRAWCSAVPWSSTPFCPCWLPSCC